MFIRLKHYLHILHWHLMNEEHRIEYFRRKGAIIGSGCSISKDVLFGTEPYLIKIGNNVRLTSGVKFITHDGGMWVIRRKYGLDNADKFGTIEIGNNVNIGWNVMIMPNVKIGDNVVIGAGAIVTKDVPSNSVVAGIPAKIIETIEDYYEKNINVIDLIKNLSSDEKKQYLIKKYRDFNNE